MLHLQFICYRYKKEQNKPLTDGWFPQFSSNSFANELFQARAGGSYLIKGSGSDNTWVFFKKDSVTDCIQGQTCQVKFDPGAECVKAEITAGKINDTINMNMCRYMAVHRLKVLFRGHSKCSRDIFVLFLCTEIFYLRVIQMYLSSYKQALKINILKISPAKSVTS